MTSPTKPVDPYMLDVLRRFWRANHRMPSYSEMARLFSYRSKNAAFRLAKKLIEEVMNSEERILKDPAAAVMVAELGDSSVNLAVRPWVKKEDYWDVRADLLEAIKLRFDANGISIPFPQRDLHVYQADLTGSGGADKAIA